jgi:hypothetical protein
MVKVALCFYGQPRYVNNTSVPESYEKYFNRPDYEVTTFGHCWYSQDAVYKSTSWMQSHEDYVVDPNTINTLQSYYNFDKFLVERPKTFRFLNDEIRENYKKINHSINFNELRENNILSHLYSIEAVTRLVPETFDFYVLCRYDTVITDIPDLTKANPDRVYLPDCGDFSDIVIIFGKRFLEWPRHTYSISQSQYLPIEGFMPEHFKKYVFYNCNFTREETIVCPMFGHIARSE